MENKTDVGKNTVKRRAVLYCRVATDSDEGRSLEMQKKSSAALRSSRVMW